MPEDRVFDINCTKCPRLDDFLADVRRQHPTYHARPVPAFGSERPALLIVGLAPGMHGANATGRPFTGDYAGLLLYETLYKFGYSNQPQATSLDDGLRLDNCRITNAVKCLPPQNKPSGDEIRQCNAYLAAELRQLPEKTIIMALGGIAHRAVLRAYGMPLKSAVFAHNSVHRLPDGRLLVDSYHCSRYNIQTKRLTAAMFEDVFRQVAKIYGHGRA